MMVAGRAGGIAPLLDAIFSFLYRKTDFYHVMREGDKMGFPPGVAEKLVLGHFRKYEQLAIKAREKQQTSAPKGAAAAVEAKQPAPSPAAQPVQPAAAATPVPKAAPAARAAAADHAPGARAVDARDEPSVSSSHLASTVGLESTYNGGQTELYVWEQTISDVTITVPVPAGTKSRDIACVIGRGHLRLQLNGQPSPLLDSDYPCDDRNGQCVWEQVKPAQCFWNLSDAKCTIYLEKERECWWKSALHGHLEIDTTKVDSVKRVEEYDGETQGAIRKIMFDQDQKRKGLPTSDELGQIDVLKQVGSSCRARATHTARSALAASDSRADWPCGSAPGRARRCAGVGRGRLPLQGHALQPSTARELGGGARRRDARDARCGRAGRAGEASRERKRPADAGDSGRVTE
jgi:hypothetical protein